MSTPHPKRRAVFRPDRAACAKLSPGGAGRLSGGSICHGSYILVAFERRGRREELEPHTMRSMQALAVHMATELKVSPS